MIKCEVNRIEGSVSGKEISEIVEKIFKHLKIKNTNVSIAIVDNKAIKKINKDYRGKNKETDVLSFGERDLKKDFVVRENDNYLGEIIISYPEIKKQSKEDKKPIRYILKKLLIHGILHLLGYEHERGGQEEKKMFKIQEDILEKIK